MSPPITGTPASASPSYSSITSARSVSGGAASVTTRPSGSAPEAARSLRLTAAARKPRSRQEIRSSRKWTPWTSASWVTTRPPGSAAVSSAMLTASPRRSSSASSPSSPTSASRTDPDHVDGAVARAEADQPVRDRPRRRRRGAARRRPAATDPARAARRASPSGCTRRRASPRRRGAAPGSRRGRPVEEVVDRLVAVAAGDDHRRVRPARGAVPTARGGCRRRRRAPRPRAGSA